MDTGLAGSSVLVTGASGGIGSATARAMAGEGARVIVHHHRGRERAQKLAEELGGRQTHPTLPADLRDPEAVDELFAAAVEAVGRLDAVVVNHGIWPSEPRPVHTMSLERWRATLTTDLDSAFLVCRAFLKHLASAPREQASMVLVGSTAALFGEAGHADYAAAKAALTYGLCRSLKNEIVQLAPRGRVNAVCPGWTATPMAGDHVDDPQLVARATATVPLGKIATPDDVASAIVYLTSPILSGHVSGAVLPVAGGMEGRLLHGELR